MHILLGDFEDKKTKAINICHIILKSVSAHPVPQGRVKGERNIGIPPGITYPSGFFGGAAANLIGGAGILLLISQSHDFHIKMGCGKRTNTRAELMALWDLLYF